jgi:hypothetical protein
MSKLQTKLMLFIGLGAMALTPTVRADEWNQKTVITFSGPVEVPGRILNAGTYVFKLADSPAHRHIVQVFSEDQTQVFATFLALPDFRMKASEKTIITFEERPAGSPDAIKGWVYPGQTIGHEFVYPKAKAVELAHTRHTPVPAVPNELAPEMIEPSATLNGPEVAALDAAPLLAEEPDGAEVEAATVFLPAPAPVEHSELPQELPATATGLPLIGLLGATSLGLGLGLQRLAARNK